MSKHTIKATRSGFHESVGDWDADYEITFTYSRGARDQFNGLKEPDEIAFVSINPGAGDHGAFSDLAQQDLEDWATNWLDDEGYDAAVAVATSKSDAGA